jgi:hypothetical protein
LASGVRRILVKCFFSMALSVTHTALHCHT